jgi:hypothetical protein
MNKLKLFNKFTKFTEFIYGTAALLLSLYALTIIFSTVWKITFGILNETISRDTILQSISAIIISIAIVDISKYFIEEEIFHKKELRSPNEARMTLTRVFVIISISLSLEGLVYVFRAGEIDISLLPYPALLVITSILTMVGLGHYQKNSVSTENELIADIYMKIDRDTKHRLSKKKEVEEDLKAETSRVFLKNKREKEEEKIKANEDHRILKEQILREIRNEKAKDINKDETFS